MGRASRSRNFHRAVAYRGVKIGQFASGEIQNVRGEAPRSRPAFHQPEFRRRAHPAPHFRELPREQAPKNRVHIHAGDVIRLRRTLRILPRVIAELRMIETRAHKFGKRDWPMRGNFLREKNRERRGRCEGAR